MGRWFDHPSGRTPIQGRSRAVVKTLGYRFLMLVITSVVAFAFTADVKQALGIGVVANVAKTGTYYAYERIWAHVAWGLERPGDE